MGPYDTHGCKPPALATTAQPAGHASDFDIRLTAVEEEPKIHDLHLAELLGFDYPVNIRKLIRRHAAALADLGLISTVEKRSGGRPATEFYLNQEQALFIITKSETPNAIALTVALVQRFMAYERGEITAAPVEQPPARALPATYLEALEALVETERERLALEKKVTNIMVDTYRTVLPRAQCGNPIRHHVRYRVNVLLDRAFPEAEDLPPIGLEFRGNFLVALDVPLDLRHPPILTLSSDCRPERVLAFLDEITAMPEIAVNEYDEAGANKHEVRPSRQFSIMEAVSKAPSPKLPTQGNLRLAVLAFHLRHHRRGNGGAPRLVLSLRRVTPGLSRHSRGLVMYHACCSFSTRHPGFNIPEMRSTHSSKGRVCSGTSTGSGWSVENAARNSFGIENVTGAELAT
ncbi:MAG TPA: hypothetical protein VF212_00950 [Longimicrobiales bacterium]